MTLPDLLRKLGDNINALRTRSTDSGVRTALRVQADKIYALHRTVVEKTLDENSLAYKSAVGVLQEAVTMSQEAIDDLAQTVSLLQKVSDIVNQAEKAVKSIAPILN